MHTFFLFRALDVLLWARKDGFFMNWYIYFLKTTECEMYWTKYKLVQLRRLAAKLCKVAAVGSYKHADVINCTYWPVPQVQMGLLTSGVTDVHGCLQDQSPTMKQKENIPLEGATKQKIHEE